MPVNEIGAMKVMRHSTLQSPEDQSGTVIGSQMVLARSDSATIVLHILIGFPDGILTDLGLHLRKPEPGRAWVDALRDEGRDDRFRIGFAFDEPTEPLPFRTSLGAHEPVWYHEISIGSDAMYAARLWISPYPPNGVLAVSTAWEERGVPRTDTRLAVPTVEEIDMRTVNLWE